MLKLDSQADYQYTIKNLQPVIGHVGQCQSGQSLF